MIVTYIQPIIFVLLLAVVAFFAFKYYGRVVRNIKMGKAKKIKGNLKSMILLALGQKKMFRKPLPAFLHLFVYLAFVVTQIELIEIIVDGITGQHRLFMPYLGGFYTFLISFIEFLSLGALIATVFFLYRRNVMKVKRFQQPEMTGWPKLDANIILIAEIFLVCFIFMMNGSDMALQAKGDPHYAQTGSFLFSQMLVGPLQGLSASTLIIMERIGWWGHILIVFGFILYLPFSKHFHIFLAFPNSYFLEETPQGEMENMPEITNEVRLMLDPSAATNTDAPPPEKFGASDITDLTWKNLLDAYSCTECGRCTDACPANQTGKKLSPRKIMMDTRDRADELGKFISNNKEDTDGKALLSDEYISKEEIMACTTCNACVTECPVSINPLNIILELRRNLILEKADSPEEWNLMFTNIENNMAPWQFNPMDRDKWVNDLLNEESEK